MEVKTLETLAFYLFNLVIGMPHDIIRVSMKLPILLCYSKC